MNQDQELAIVRRAYAKQIMAKIETGDARLEAAFADVRREAFLGPGPWPIMGWSGEYVPNADPACLYVDQVIGLIPERHVNNGQPSLHAMLLARAAPQPGEHVVHIGAGTGYYTAIMARLVGPSGRVTGIELDPELAARARNNLSSDPNVRIIQGDGTVVPCDIADVIYVNAGATRPADTWLEGLSDGGRLILPLTTDRGFMRNDPPIPIERRGAVFRIECRSGEFLARWISPVAIFPCEGARDTASEAALAEAFAKGGWERVTRLWRNNDPPEDRCWLRAPGWCLTRDDPDFPSSEITVPGHTRAADPTPGTV